MERGPGGQRSRTDAACAVTREAHNAGPWGAPKGGGGGGRLEPFPTCSGDRLPGVVFFGLSGLGI